MHVKSTEVFVYVWSPPLVFILPDCNLGSVSIIQVAHDLSSVIIAIKLERKQVIERSRLPVININW